MIFCLKIKSQFLDIAEAFPVIIGVLIINPTSENTAKKILIHRMGSIFTLNNAMIV